MRVVIIIPTYNEKGNIEKLINILEEEIFPKIKKYEMCIVVADDNSPDGTGNIVENLIKKYKNLYLIKGEKRGLGAAYVRAMSYVVKKLNADVMFEIDADLSHDPNKIPEFLQKIDEGYDFVIGTRYSQGGSIPSNWGLHRKLFSIFGNMLVRIILMRLWIHDWTGGFRAIKKEVFLREKNELTAFRGYTFQVSFLHKAVRDGFRIAEVPIHFKDRTLGRSKIAPREYIVDLLKYVILARAKELKSSPFTKYALTGFTGYLINAVVLEVLRRKFNLSSGTAASFGAEFSIVWNFTINNFWSFSDQKITALGKLIVKFLQFNLVALGSLVIIGIVVGLGTHFFGDITLVRQVSLVVGIGFFVIPYSYTMYNIFIWKRWHISFLSKLQRIIG